MEAVVASVFDAPGDEVQADRWDGRLVTLCSVPDAAACLRVYGLSEAAAAIRGDQGEINERLGRQYAAIFEAHALLVEDPVMVGEIEALIRENHYAAEYAVSARFET